MNYRNGDIPETDDEIYGKKKKKKVSDKPKPKSKDSYVNLYIK